MDSTRCVLIAVDVLWPIHGLHASVEVADEAVAAVDVNDQGELCAVATALAMVSAVASSGTMPRSGNVPDGLNGGDWPAASAGSQLAPTRKVLRSMWVFMGRGGQSGDTRLVL